MKAAFSSTSDPWVLRSPSESQVHIRLFCFPYSGGGASLYRKWAHYLPSTIDVCPVQLPGREERLSEKAFTHMEPLISALAHALKSHLDLPFAFFGHSMGGLIGFELARYLRRSNIGLPVRLFISGSRAPQIPYPDMPISQLSKEVFTAKLRALKGTPDAILQKNELLEVFLPTLRADFALCETYVYAPEAPLACPISVFGGVKDHGISYSDLTAWQTQTSGSFSLRMLPGDHFFLHSSLNALLESMQQDLVVPKK